MTEPTNPAQPLARLQKHGLRATRALDLRTKEAEIRFEAPAQINIASMQIHRSVSIGAYSSLHSGGLVKVDSIGRYCTIGRNVILGEPAYNMGWLCTSQIFSVPGAYKWYAPEKEDAKKRWRLRRAKALDQPALGPVTIGNDVRIGANAVVREGVHIGDGAIIAPGADVDRDVEPYSIVAGVPARLVGKRFDEATVQALLDLRWWDFHINDLYGVSFENPAEAIPMLAERELAGAIRRWPVAYGAVTVTREGYTGLRQPSRAATAGVEGPEGKAPVVKPPREAAKEPPPDVADAAIAASAFPSVQAEAPEPHTVAPTQAAADPSVDVAPPRSLPHDELAEAIFGSALPEMDALSSEGWPEPAANETTHDETPSDTSAGAVPVLPHDGEASSLVAIEPVELEAASPDFLSESPQEEPALDEMPAGAGGDMSPIQPATHDGIAETAVAAPASRELQAALPEEPLEAAAREPEPDETPAAASSETPSVPLHDDEDGTAGVVAALDPIELEAASPDVLSVSPQDEPALDEMAADTNGEMVASDASAHDEIAEAMIAALASRELEAALADESFEQPAKPKAKRDETLYGLTVDAVPTQPEAHDEFADAVIAALNSGNLKAASIAGSAEPEGHQPTEDDEAAPELAEAANAAPATQDEPAATAAADPDAFEPEPTFADAPSETIEKERAQDGPPAAGSVAPAKATAHDDIAEALVAALASRELEAALSGYQATPPAAPLSSDGSEAPAAQPASPTRRRLGDWSLGLADGTSSAPAAPAYNAGISARQDRPTGRHDLAAVAGDEPDPSALPRETQAGEDKLMETVLAALTLEGLESALEDHRRETRDREKPRSDARHAAAEAQADGEYGKAPSAAQIPSIQESDEGEKPGRARFVFPWNR